MSCKGILVVDDDDDVRLNVALALEAEGYMVWQTANGQEALDFLKSRAQEEMPGLIILDLMMPKMDGFGFLKTRREQYQDQFGDIPVIVATAKGSAVNPEAVPDAIERLQKPMELEVLYEAVARYCGKP